MPEELYQLLAVAVQQTLLTSDSVQDAISDISAAGFDIRLDVWAKSTLTLFDILSDEDQHLDLFAGGIGDHHDLSFDWQTTDEDIHFLRCIGIYLPHS